MTTIAAVQVVRDVPVRLRRPNALALVLLLGTAAGCGQSGPSGGQGGMPPGGMPAMPVQIETLTPKPVDQLGDFVGTIKSRGSTTIQPQVEGFLTRIVVNSGDRVKVGTPLMDIDDSSQRALVASLESTQAARQADATYARQQSQRAKKLLETGAMSQQEYEQAVNQEQTADAQLKAASDQVTQQRSQLAYYHIVAPVAGIVGDIPVRVGDRVTNSTVLTTINDNAALEVYISVPVQQAPQLQIGLPVRLVTDAGDVITATKISFISPSVDDATQTVLVKAPVATDTHLRTDQFVRAQIVWSTAPGLTIPVVSVIRINGQYFAFVAQNTPKGTIAHQQAVALGRIVDNSYLVLSGLKAGDQLIVSGLQKIGDGSPVRGGGPPGPAGAGAPGGGAAGREGGRGQ
jgi:RND family efflux transporter MFP subunit